MSGKSSWVLGALVAGLSLQTGCAEERDAINQVQANAMHKSFFVGEQIQDRADDPEFYSAVTVVDVPFGADQAGVFTGLVGGLKRVKWEITEKALNARLAYELIEGVDGHGASRTDSDGIVIASWPILSHFDIRNAYNPSTGEELNVIVENTTDRPWDQREYFRVDWGQNLIGSSRLWDPLGGADYDVEPLQYYVNDPTHPDRPVFEVDDGYFDVTNKMHLLPKRINLGAGKAPACFYRGSIVLGATYPWGNCDNTEITARYSFRRVAQEGEAGYTDYQPVEWDGSRMRSFGAFVQQRLGWDRNYGIVDSEWHYFAQRYNIWEKSHLERECANDETTPFNCSASRDGDVDCNGKVEPEKGEIMDGTHDECEDGENFGSKCDKLVGKCTIPFSKRTPKPVAWHFTVNAEDTVMYESTEEATWQWDAAMRVAVQVARYSECVRTGTKSLTGSPWEKYKNDAADITAARGICGALYPVDQSYDESEQDAVREVNICAKNGGTDCLAKVTAVNPQYLEALRGADSGAMKYSVAAMKPMVALCHSPVAEGDHEACGDVGDVARPGDIRYHQVNVWPTRQTLSPWGYGPSLADPLTGEIISAGINVYNAVTDNAAQGFLDQIRWINGEISSKDITDGEHTFEWVKASAYEDMHTGPMMTQDDINKRLSGISGIEPGDRIQHLHNHDALEAMQELEKTAVPPGVIPEDRAIFDERIEKAKETGVEAELMNPMWLQMAGLNQDDLPADWSAEDQLDVASPLRMLDSKRLLLENAKLERQLAQHGQCILAAPEPTSIPAVAKIMKNKFPYNADASPEENHARWEQMWNYLRYKLNYNVILHEMGHTISLRHNFVSSWDKYNFKTQYWQLRTDSGRVTQQCNGPQTDGANCVGPRYFDPLTQDEIDNAIWTWQQTSVMDYAGDITQDMLGLGVYDMAATRMFYADAVDVRADTVVTEQIGGAVQSIVDNPGYLVDQAASFGIHYTGYNELFKIVQPDRCTPVDPVKPDWWEEDKYGVWDPLFDGRIVHNERCRRPPVDYVQWEDLVPDQITVAFEDPEFFTPRRPKDLYDRPRVPYGFLTDEYADGWSPSAFRHDNGADTYEELVFHTNLYENRHIFENYRNGRVNFTVYGAYQRALARYHAKIENLTQGMAYIVGYFLKELAVNENVSFEELVASQTGPGTWLYNQAIAAGVGFDHFVRVMTRPHTGAHSCPGDSGGCNPNANDRVIRPIEDLPLFNDGVPAGHTLAGYMPNGIFVAGDSLSFAGRPIDNNFQYSHGHWTFNYLNQAGSYYEKTYAIQSMLNATYGAINFFRLDGVDARFRHVNFTDLFPDGMRRFIGVALTEDHELLGPRVSATSTGKPNFGPSPFADADDETAGERNYPMDPMAWVSYIPAAGPVACAPVQDVLSCVDTLGTPIRNGAPAENTAWAVDPQLGYEVQKFIVFWYYVYQPGKQMWDWVELMRIFKLGSDLDPDYLPDEFLEWKDPESGHRYIAKKYGDETIFGKAYDKGIAAKMIQWANHLTSLAYELDPTTPFDPATGRANVVLDTNGEPVLKDGKESCDDSKPCFQLRRYRGLLDFTRDTAARLGFPEAGLQIFAPPD